MKKPLPSTQGGTVNHLAMWGSHGQGPMGVVDCLNNVDQVCCICRPGEMDDIPATSAETRQDDNQKTNHTKQSPKKDPQTLTALIPYQVDRWENPESEGRIPSLLCTCR